MANSWINIVRAHPTILKKYEVIFQPDFIFYFSLYFRKFKYALWWPLFISKVILSKKKLPSNLINNVDYLFISHLVNEDQFKNKKDQIKKINLLTVCSFLMDKNPFLLR
jgi:hypothetical protein